VNIELNNMNWNINQINTETLIDEFILLFIAMNDVVLTEEKDAISSKWTTSGEYTTTSAYDIQFLGTFPMFNNATTIWKAKTRAKCRFFAWLAVWKKAPTTDNLMKKNWSCDPSCALCYCIPGMNDHMLMECNFSEGIWDKIAQDCHLHPALIPFQKGDIKNWVATISRAGSKQEQCENIRVVFFF
jgi:hypothetical protein